MDKSCQLFSVHVLHHCVRCFVPYSIYSMLSYYRTQVCCGHTSLTNDNDAHHTTNTIHTNTLIKSHPVDVYPLVPCSLPHPLPKPKSPSIPQLAGATVDTLSLTRISQNISIQSISVSPCCSSKGGKNGLSIHACALSEHILIWSFFRF
jgi:hypothetical protein